jgi:outer membrane protein TolC
LAVARREAERTYIDRAVRRLQDEAAGRADKFATEGSSMVAEQPFARLWVALLLLNLAWPWAAAGQGPPASLPPAPPAVHPSAPVRLTLDEAKQRALANNKLLALAAGNIQAKEWATRAVRADYFPKVIGNSTYFHFDNPLGTVFTTPGRIVSPIAVEANVLNQDSSFSTVFAAQPITALLKVRQGVRIAQADEQIAKAELEKGQRAVAAGVEQLFWGILTVRRIRAGAQVAVEGATEAAKTKIIEARIALVEARQGLQQAETQLADLEAQLNDLLDLPPCTKVELIEPPFPLLPVKCADEAVDLALGASPEVRMAEQDVEKARAAVAAAKVDNLPNIAIVGGYGKQTFASYIQQDINYVGITGTYTFFEWGKKKYTVRERQQFIALAELKVDQARDDVRQKALKQYRELGEARDALETAAEMVQVRKEADAKAVGLDKFHTSKKLMEAEVDLAKADLAYRVAHVKLLSLLGQ